MTHLRSRVVDNLLCGQIALVADKQLVDVLASVAVDLLKPLLHVVERLLIGHVVDDDDAVGTAVVTEMKKEPLKSTEHKLALLTQLTGFDSGHFQLFFLKN